MDLITLLQSVSIFRGIEPSLLSQLAALLKRIELSENTEIFKEGQIADAFYIIDSGNVVIAKHLGPNNEKILAVLGQGSVFGEMAFFADAPRTATATTATSSVLLSIRRAAFTQFIAHYPSAGLRILSGLIQVSMDRLEYTSRELATVYETGKLIAAGFSTRAMARDVLDALMMAIPAATCGAVYLYNEFNNDYDPVAAPGGATAVPEAHPAISAMRLYNMEQVHDTSVLQLPLFSGARSLLVVPMLKNGILRGFIALWNMQINSAFGKNQFLLTTSVAGQMSEAVENMRNRENEANRERLNRAQTDL